MRSAALAGAIAGAVLLAGCGGSSASHRSAAPSAPATPSAPPADAVPAPAAPPPTPSSVAGPGTRSVTTISTCLTQHEVATTAPPVPAGMHASPQPQVLLAMPWNAVAISVYDKPQTSTSTVTVSNGGAVMSRGNVSMALDRIPEPPASVMRTIEACALG